MKDKEKTVAVFRKWRKGYQVSPLCDIIALFPHVWAGDNHCSSYEHVGQHGGADYQHCIRNSRPAKPSEYADLKKELEGLGYNLEIRKRASVYFNQH